MSISTESIRLIQKKRRVVAKGSIRRAATWNSERIAELEKDNDRLRNVLAGVRNAIKPGQNEPLQIWLDQINIALEEPKT